MAPEDFEALLRLVPEETFREYAALINEESLRRAEDRRRRRGDPAVATSASGFIWRAWSEKLIEQYLEKSVLSAMVDNVCKK